MVSQPPDGAGEAQASDGGQVVGSQNQTGVSAGVVPSSAAGNGTATPASGVAGAGTGTGTLRTPSGPSSATSTVQIAGSGRTFGSGALLGMVTASVVVLIWFDVVGW